MIDASVRRPFDRFCWWSATAVLVLHAINLARFAVDWPFHDDFTQILAVPGYLAQVAGWREKLDLLFGLSIEHRIVTLRLAGWLGSLVPGGLDFRLLIVVGNLLGLAAGVLAVLAFPRDLRAFAALLAALMLASPTMYGAQFWATGALQHYGVSCYALAALFALHRGWPAPLPLAFALLAAFTSANGLMVFPAVVLMLLVAGRPREALAWTIAAVLLASVYFIGYEKPEGRAGFDELARAPVRIFLFGMATLGGLAGEWLASIVTGSSIFAAWIMLVFSGKWRRVPPWIIAAFVFFAATCAAIAVGRAALGSEAAALSRYRMYSAFAILATAAAVLPLMAARTARIVAVALLAIATVAFGRAWLDLMPQVVELAMMQKGGRDHFAAEGRGFYGSFPPRNFGDYTLDRARLIGSYDGARRAGPVLPLIPGSHPDAKVPTVHQSYLEQGDKVFTVGGTLGGRHRSVELWLDDDRRAFRAEFDGQRFFAGAIGERRTAFHGTVSLAGLPPGEYRVGYSGSAMPGVAWTAHRVTLREPVM